MNWWQNGHITLELWLSNPTLTPSHRTFFGRMLLEVSQSSSEGNKTLIYSLSFNKTALLTLRDLPAPPCESLKAWGSGCFMFMQQGPAQASWVFSAGQAPNSHAALRRVELQRKHAIRNNMDGPTDYLLSEVSQTGKDKHHMIPFICAI